MTDAASGTAATMQELPVEECYRLLATQEVGRLGMNAEHYPLIIPVNYGTEVGAVPTAPERVHRVVAADTARSNRSARRRSYIA